MRQYDYSRQWPDPRETFFSDPLMLDRYRVLHSTSFRRLGYKTQVFLPLEADHLRTRLTHTLEVSMMSGLLAERFGASAPLAEVISLAHDLGHGPFGHSSERILNKLLADVGGFEHNHQSLRVVEYLEGPYPYFRGLNLTRATRSGLEVHNTPYDRPDMLDASGDLEGQIANWADRLAYNAADLEDALGAGFLTGTDLSELSLYRQAWGCIEPAIREKPLHALRRVVLETIQNILIEAIEIRDLSGQPFVTIRDAELDALKELERFLYERVYRCPQLAKTAQTLQEIISRIFHRYQKEPDLLPARFLSRRQDTPLERIIGDYIAGMTDRFCLKVYRQMFGADDKLPASIEPVIGLGSM